MDAFTHNAKHWIDFIGIIDSLINTSKNQVYILLKRSEFNKLMGVDHKHSHEFSNIFEGKGEENCIIFIKKMDQL